MKQIFLGLILCVFLFSCGGGTPSGIIRQPKMEQVLYDMHVVDGYTSTVYPEDSSKKVTSAYYKGIYKKFDIDSTSFTQSLAYYSKKPDLMQKMYKSISAKLKAQKKYMEKRDSIELKRVLQADSIKLKVKAKEDSVNLAKKLKIDTLAKKIKPKKNLRTPKNRKVEKRVSSLNKERF